jgi:hypothetical protein
MTPEMVVNDVDRGREAYEQRAWLDAYEALSRADARSPLATQDLELLAVSASMVGRIGDYLALLERTHHAYLESDQLLRAAGAAIWIGMNLAARGELGPAAAGSPVRSGWSNATAETAWSGGGCSCRSRFSRRRQATTTRRSQR